MPTPPVRRLRERPDLDQLKSQAKELLAAFVAGEPEAVAEVNAHYRGADPASFALHHAQLVLARSHGFDSWPKLKAYVDGVTVTRLAEAVRAGDRARVRAMLKARPELVHMEMAHNDEHQALHYAVLERSPEMVRVLIEHGADARKGIYPHRSATSALTLAAERGYDEIVAIIEEGEQRRREADEADRRPAAKTATDELLAAIARGDAAWLRARHAERSLASPTVIDIFAGSQGLLTMAVKHDRPEILSLLLDLGLDPDERMRVDGLEEVEFTWGMPLWHCADLGRHAMAETLLRHGADPNGPVYASGSPVYSAYRRQDRAMIELLLRHGGVVGAITAGIFGETELARRMLASEADGHLEEGRFAGQTAAEQLLWGAADGGHPEIVRMALERVHWSRDDPRWYAMLWRPLWGNEDGHLASFRLMLERAHANVRGRFGMTLLHEVAGSRSYVTAERQVAFAEVLLDAGARLDVRDDLLKSTPLGWACRWGRIELVKLLLERGADPVEADAEPWATPRAWAEKKGHGEVLAALSR